MKFLPFFTRKHPTIEKNSVYEIESVEEDNVGKKYDEIIKKKLK